MTINASGATRAGAAAALREKVNQYERGLTVEVDNSATLAQYLDWWLTEELAEQVADGSLMATTREQYANKVQHQIVPLIGHLRLRDVSPLHLRQWQTKLSRAGASPSLRGHTLAVLKNALERAVRYELLPSNAAKLVVPPPVQRQRRNEVTFEGARALLRAAQGDDLEAAYVLALHIPMRVGEVVGAEWDCVDFDRGLFSVRQNIVRVDGRWEIHGTKTHTPRVVPLPEAVLIALRRQRARQAEQRLAAGSAWAPPEIFDSDRRAWRLPEFVFTRATGKPYLQQGFYKQLRALCVRAEVVPLATHDLRRAANTLLRMAGVDPAVIRQLAGHKTEDMTELYTTDLTPAWPRQLNDSLCGCLDCSTGTATHGSALPRAAHRRGRAGLDRHRRRLLQQRPGRVVDRALQARVRPTRRARTRRRGPRAGPP